MWRFTTCFFWEKTWRFISFVCLLDNNEKLNHLQRKQLFDDLVEENKQIVIGLEAENQLKKNEIEAIVTQSQVIEKENKMLRESILTTKLNESSLETVFQTVIQLLLLLLNLTGKNLFLMFMNHKIYN